MRRETAYIAITSIAVVLCATACDFKAPANNGPDGPEAAAASFLAEGSVQDESSAMFTVPVVLSRPTGLDVTVKYTVSDGTAINGVDFNGEAGELFFPSGETMQGIPLEIINDGMEEGDETFDLQLTMVTGGKLGATTSHTVTISGRILPRVTLSTATSSRAENSGTAAMVQLDLNTASAVPVTVMYEVSGSATTADRALTSGTVIFQPGSLMEQRPLGIVDDALDEDNETVVVKLVNATEAIIGVTSMQTHTIEDNDPTPTVQFMVGSSTATEGATQTTITVRLSAVSGRTVTVPFALDGASSAAASDFSVPTGSPLQIPELTMTSTITIDIVQDAIDEIDETVIFDLQTPTNATLGATSSHTLTIVDDEASSYGTGTYQVNLAAPPMNAVTLPATINTNSGSANCAPAQPMGWVGAQSPACFVIGQTITTNTNVAVTGNRPLVLVASETLTISHTLDVASHRGGTSGPGAPSAACDAFPQAPQGSSGAGGGAGASFMSKGGDGGQGNGGNQAGTAPNAEAAAPTALRAGCHGQRGGNSDGNNSGAVGEGGGAVYLVAGNALTISSVINASGSAGTGGGPFTGGSGAGSGGMIVLYAPAITASGATLMANGGGAAGGGDNNASGNSGSDPASTAPLTPAPGGPMMSAGGAGGAGFAGTTQAATGESVGSNRGGGGGGGGGGYIQANLALGGATTSAGRIDAP